jgi:hypothetical protein
VEALPAGFTEGIGVVGVVLLVFWLVWSGRLVTKRELDKAEHDRDEWRTESRIKDQQMQVKDDQLAHLAEVGRTVDAIMRALKSGPPTAPPPGTAGGA